MEQGMQYRYDRWEGINEKWMSRRFCQMIINRFLLMVRWEGGQGARWEVKTTCLSLPMDFQVISDWAMMNSWLRASLISV
jgi:hypothetical protein